jgi:MFS family permease
MHGLYLVWLVQERGFPPALVATVLAAGDLCVFALEVPTGWAADRLGHRRSLIIGSFVQVLGMAALWLAASTPMLVVASLLVAIGDAFRSGADEALLYRTCVALGRESDFQRIEARTAAVGTLALVGLLVGGAGIVAVAGYTAAWLAEIALSVAGLVLAWLMIEPPTAGVESAIGAADVRLGSPPAERVSPWTFVGLIVPSAMLDGLAAASAFLAQTRADAQIAGITALVAAITLSEAAGAWSASRLGSSPEARAWRNDGRLHLLLLVSGAVILAVSLMVPAGAAVGAVTLAFLPGLIQPLRSLSLQRLAGDGVRARIASLASACDMACSTLGLLVAGAVSARRRR